jgi:hypothetical protein
MSEGYHPEVDDSPLCTEDDSAKYRSIIGCCIWIIVLGRIDIAYAFPRDLPPEKFPRVRMTIYVDADHAHDLVTRRSITGILFMLNNTPIPWIFNFQKTFETSTYGSELVASRIATELIREVRYMLRSLGVALDRPVLKLGNNMSVVLNTTVPSSVLKKNHNAIPYHRVREAIAARIMRFVCIKSEENVSDFEKTFK